MRGLRGFRCLAGAACALAAASAVAQEPKDFAAYSPRFEAIRIEAGEAPKIDGDLSDPAWSKAAVITEFYQVEPEEGRAPTQPTRALVMYDEKRLYVGVYNYDNEPDKIVRKLMARDSRLQDEDAVRIMIDSFGTFRDGYFFATNANGARVDALIENNSLLRPEWNTIWTVKARVVADGWIAEFSIPFQSISFDASLEDWGFQILRTIRRSNEEIRWSNIDRSRDRIDLTNRGSMSGVEDVQSGIGLEAQLFVTGAAAYDWELDDVDVNLDPSANFFYKITPALTGSLTFNTDFSDAPLDARQVNTGRFSLFFPETRDFFLQDASVFEFGGRVFSDEPNGLPFFSRRIGIVNGRPVDIIAGAKLSGKLGPANVGAIATRTGQAGTIDGQYLTAGRASIPVLAESKAGIVFTHGDPAGAETNTVGGVDFQYKNSSRWPGTLFADFAYVQSLGGGDDGYMAAADVAYRSTRWNWTGRFEHIGEDYNPRLGFVNRTDVRRYRANFFRAYRPENSFIRVAETGTYVNIVTDLDDEVEDRAFGGWVFVGTDAGDETFIEVERTFLDIRDPFDIAGIVPVPVGEYRFTQYEINVGFSQARLIGGRAEVRWGDIFGGDYLEVESSVSFKPGRHFTLGAGHEFTQFSLPTGTVDIHVGRVDATIAFSPSMFLRTDIQYDNISENLTWFSRFTWEPTPEREIFVSFGHTAIIERDNFPESFRAQGTNVALRLGNTVRF
jgi:hypothetical protein